MPRSSAAGSVARSLVLATLGVALLAGPTLAQKNPFEPDAPAATSSLAGTYSGEGTQMTLTPDGRGGYAGQITLGNNAFPLVATEANGTLNGTFTANGQQFPFSAQTRPDGAVVFKTGNNTRTLQRAGGGNVVVPGPGPNVPNVNNNAGRRGGIGLSAEPKNGLLTVTGVTPGGPAAKSKVPVGGVIRAVDNKDIEGMSPEQIFGMIRGEPGTLVTVTVETANEVTDYVLQRADLGGGQQPTPGPTPTPAPNPNPNPGPINGQQSRGVAAQPGVRVTYATMLAPVPNATRPLEQDENNNWIDGQTRQPVQFDATPRVGSVAYNQFTIVAADPREIVSDYRTFMVVDLQRQASLNTLYGTVGGTMQSNLGDVWVPPEGLARMQDGDMNGMKFKRIDYQFAGEKFKAMSIRRSTPQMFSNSIYDLETGFLIVSGMSAVMPQQQQQPPMNGGGGGQPTPFGNDQFQQPQQQQQFPQQQQQQQQFPQQQQQPQGQVMVTINRMVGKRQLNVPWAAQAMPAWARQGTKLEYAGTYQAGQQQAAKATCVFALGEPRQTWLPAEQSIRVEAGGGQPMQQQFQRALGNSTFDPLYIDPQVLARLQPGQVLDEDKATQRTITYTGPQGEAAVITEQSPIENGTYKYNLRSGVMMSYEGTTRDGQNTDVTSLQLTNPPQ